MASFSFEIGRQYPIDKGPDKERLMVSHWHGDSRERIPVKFRLNGNRIVWVDAIINRAEREDGSGENWLLSGYIVERESFVYKFEAFFSLRERKGFMKFFSV